MKFDKMKLALAAIGLVNLSQAMAANTTTVGVTATVQGICKFSAATGSTLNFGTIDPSGTTAATATVGLPFQCTKSSSSAASISSGGTALVNGTNTMTYSSSLTSAVQTGSGFGSNPTLTMTLNGSIAVSAYQAAPALAYADSIVVSITP